MLTLNLKMVCVFDKDNNPPMPTNRHGRVRHLLEDKIEKLKEKAINPLI